MSLLDGVSFFNLLSQLPSPRMCELLQQYNMTAIGEFFMAFGIMAWLWPRSGRT
jgi:hypothetical protein